MEGTYSCGSSKLRCSRSRSFKFTPNMVMHTNYNCYVKTFSFSVFRRRSSFVMWIAKLSLAILINPLVVGLWLRNRYNGNHWQDHYSYLFCK